MAWSEWKEHDGKGYPAPVGTRVNVKNHLVIVGEGRIGESGSPEGLSSWSWRMVDGTPHCFSRSTPFTSYQIWTDEGEKRQVEALKAMITPEKLAEFKENTLVPEPQ